jgi:hypothetical protein
VPESTLSLPAALPALLTDAGLWVGLLLTLALFSLLLGDHALARTAWWGRDSATPRCWPCST